MNKFIPKNYSRIKVRQKLKYKKQTEYKDISLRYGSIGLKSTVSGQISAQTLEVVRRGITRRIKKIGKIVFHIHPNIPLTQKSSGLRMGKGKGAFSEWVIPVKKGKILLELVDTPTNLGIIALKSVMPNLSIKTKIII